VEDKGLSFLELRLSGSVNTPWVIEFRKKCHFILLFNYGVPWKIVTLSVPVET